MRRLVLWFVLAFAAPVDAQSATTTPTTPATPTPTPTTAPKPTPATPTTAPTPLPPATPTERQVEEDNVWRGPSGFWTNPRPAKGGRYRWRMMAIGGVLLLFTAYMVLRVVKKANAERAARK